MEICEKKIVNSHQKTAVVTGITGQDGAYLSKLLLDKGYQNVIGTYRRSSTDDFWRIKELGIDQHPRFHRVTYDLTDPGAAIHLLQTYQPHEVYNLAAQSFVKCSFDAPVATAIANAMGPLHLLEAIRWVNPNIRFYQASTSEMFGKVQAIPQNEKTPFYPRSPYGVAKLYAHWATINYRESYDIFSVSGILFNHESPLRGEEFVTRKITKSLAQIKTGMIDCMELGNLDAKRDWGYAPEYVEGMWLMLQASQPNDYVLATGQTHTVRDFLRMAGAALGFDLHFEGKGIEEIARDAHTGQVIVRISKDYYRPCEVDLLLGDANQAKTQLGWSCRSSLQTICESMALADLKRLTDSSIT